MVEGLAVLELVGVFGGSRFLTLESLRLPLLGLLVLEHVVVPL